MPGGAAGLCVCARALLGVQGVCFFLLQPAAFVEYVLCLLAPTLCCYALPCSLEYVKEAVAEADPVTKLAGLIKQRRRWLNGAQAGTRAAAAAASLAAFCKSCTAQLSTHLPSDLTASNTLPCSLPPCLPALLSFVS